MGRDTEPKGLDFEPGRSNHLIARPYPLRFPGGHLPSRRIEKTECEDYCYKKCPSYENKKYCPAFQKLQKLFVDENLAAKIEEIRKEKCYKELKIL